MGRASTILCALGLTFLTPVTSTALEERQVTREEIGDWAAFGRLSFNRREGEANFTCSATLIAPDLVLTAAHCLARQYNRGPSRVRQVVFLAGWHTDSAIASSSAERLIFHPDYRPGRDKPFEETLVVDLALIKLQTPIESIAPIPLGTIADTFELLDFMVYRGKLDVPPRLSTGCSHTFAPPNILAVGCPVVKGNSGGGVIAGEGDDRRVVAVLSAANGSRAIAVMPDEWLFREVAELTATN